MRDLEGPPDPKDSILDIYRLLHLGKLARALDHATRLRDWYRACDEASLGRDHTASYQRVFLHGVVMILDVIKDRDALKQAMRRLT